MAAETTGTDADHSDSRESSEHRVSFSLSEQKNNARDTANGVPSGPYFKNLVSRGRDPPLDSILERSASIPAVSASICVSLFSLGSRRSVVPAAYLPIIPALFLVS